MKKEKHMHTFEFRDAAGTTHTKIFEYDPENFNRVAEFDKWKREIEQKKVYLCQNKRNMLIHGCFDTKDKALNFTEGSADIAIIELIVQ